VSLLFTDDQTIISNDKEDIEYMMRKLMEEYEGWDLTIYLKETKYLCIGTETENLIMEDNREVEICKEHDYKELNREETGNQEINRRITKA